MKGQFIYIPEEQATTPAEGHCYTDRWWAVHPEKGVSFYIGRLLGPYRDEEPSPQCNSSEHTARALTAKLQPECEVKFLPVVFAKHAEREMGRLAKIAAAERDAVERQARAAKARETAG